MDKEWNNIFDEEGEENEVFDLEGGDEMAVDEF